MKKKLTLTVEEEVIKYAKSQAKRHGKSVSQLFEESFKVEKRDTIKTDAQKAAEDLMKKLDTSESTKSKRDKDLIKAHVKRKFI